MKSFFLTEFLLTFAIFLVTSNGFLVIDYKNRVVIMNQGAGMKFDDASELCHRIGGQLPQVTLKENIADRAEFLASLLEYTDKDKAHPDNSERMVWLGAKRGVEEKEYSWLKESNDAVDPSDDSYKKMDVDLKCPGTDCCALTIGPAKVDGTMKFRVTDQRCDESKVNVICRININFNDIPTKELVSDLKQKSEKFEGGITTLTEKSVDLKSTQDKIEKSPEIDNTKKAVTDVKTEVTDLDKSLKDDTEKLQAAKVESQKKIENLTKDVDDTKKAFEETANTLDGDIRKLDEKMKDEWTKWSNLMTEHGKKVNSDISNIEKEVQKSKETLAPTIEKKVSEDLSKVETSLKAEVSQFKQESEKEISQLQKRADNLEKERKETQRDVETLDKKADAIHLDKKVQEHAREALENVKKLSQDLKAIKQQLDSQVDGLEKRTNNVDKELKQLEADVGNTKDIKGMKAQLTTVKGRVDQGAQSLKGLKIGAGVILSILIVVVVVQSVFLYRKKIFHIR